MKAEKNNDPAIRELTKAEEQVMQILWDLEKGMAGQVLEKFEDPKPAYNTVSTIIRILEQKGFVGHKAYGRTHEYFPIISKKDYTSMYFKNFVSNYFGNSYHSLVSFFARDNSLSLKELEQIQQTIDKEIMKHKKSK
jgi:BlaI family transcriptional regulator, penicillinase repressor